MRNHVDDIPMSRISFAALTDAHDHLRRALSAVNACEPFDSVAMVQLDIARTEFAARLRVLRVLLEAARVTA